jgi:SAM-dependent methyltransferase
MPDQIDLQRLKSDQKRDWDAAAAGWKKWWPVFERSAQHVSDRLVELAGIKPGSRVLDVATGTGEPAVTAARRAGSTGRVIAIDQSPGMLAIARERAAASGITNIEFRESDAESLAIDEGDFDAAICRWGLMFMPDLVRTLTGLWARMADGGRLATSVWATADKVPLISLGADIVRKLANLPPPAPGTLEPMRLADTSILEGAMIQAGFQDIAIERLPVTFELDSPAGLIRFRGDVAPQFRQLLDHQAPDVRDRIIEEVTAAARAFTTPGGKLRMTNEAILFAAHR